MSGADWQQQQEVLEQQHLLTAEEYTLWLYKNYPIGNGTKLVSLLENTAIQDRYLADMGLPLDSEIKGL